MKEISVDEVKSIQLDLLDTIHAYCESKGLRYYIAYGTLLGAVRHKGFIPWDDDIDVMMPRDDYKVFISDFNKFCQATNIKAISNEIDSNYYLSFGKVINTATTMQEEVNSKYQIGVYVDVFPLDNLSDDYEASERHLKKAFLYNELLLLKNLTFSRDRKWYKNVALAVGRTAGIFWSRGKIIKRLNNYGTRTLDGGFTKYVGLICGLNTAADMVILESEWMENIVKLEFEGRLFNAPEKYDNVLKKIYGDYMELPPVEERKSHHVFRAWYND